MSLTSEWSLKRVPPGEWPGRVGMVVTVSATSVYGAMSLMLKTP